MKKKLFRIAGALFFIFLLVFFIIAANIFMTPYWRYSNDPDDAGESSRYENFYEMPDNTLDYLVIGPSNSYHSLEPMQVYAYSGITGFDLGGPSQPMYCSYYWLKEALKTQLPKLVFVDAGSFVRENPSNERILKSILPMKPSLNKLQAIRDCCSYDDELLYTALFPLYQFHSRWEEFSKKDVVRRNGEPYLSKGATIRFVSMNEIDASEVNLREEKHVVVSGDGSATAVLDEMPLNENSAYWLGKMKELCDENGIELVPIKFPTKNWNSRWSAEVQGFLDEMGLELVDLTGEKNPTGINWSKDSFDNGKHLNYYGMVKTSRYFADYLKENWSFTSHKGESAYTIWDKDLESYRSWETKEITELLQSNREKIDYFNEIAADNADYLILMSVKTDVSTYWPKSLDGAIKQLGIKTDLSSIRQQSFIAVSDAGKTVMEISDPDILNYDFKWTDENGSEHMIHIKSGGAGSDSDIEVDGSLFGLGNSGLNVVVIDKKDGSPVSAASLGSYSSDNVFDQKNAKEAEAPAILNDGKYKLSDGDSEISVEIKRSADNTYLIADSETGKYLSAAGQNKPGDKVLSEDDRGLATTKWKIYYAEDGKYWLYSVFNGMVVSMQNGELIMEELDERSEVPSFVLKSI